MSIKLFFLVILLAFAVSLAVPAGSVTAEGANWVDFTATSVNFCAMGGTDPFCQPGEYIALPNGKGFVVGYQTIMKFTASDPRWNADCYYTGKAYPPSSTQVFVASGSFVCYPTDERYAGGWWEGTVRNFFQPDKFIQEWNGKGYGTLDGLLVITYNSMSSKFDDVDPSINNVGVIIELPGYQP